MINLKRMIIAFLTAIILFYVLVFVIKAVLVLIIAIPIILGALYLFLRYKASVKPKQKDDIEEMEFEELD